MLRSALEAIAYRYVPVVASVAAALGVSSCCAGYVYPRPLVLLALVLSVWGRGLGPSLLGAGLATAAVGLIFPELLPKYGMVSDGAMFVLASVTFSLLSAAKLRAEANAAGWSNNCASREERFRAMFFRAAVGMAQIGHQGEWLLVNDPLCSILGYTPEQLLPMTFPDVTHSDDRQEAREAMHGLLGGEAAFFPRNCAWFAATAPFVGRVCACRWCRTGTNTSSP